MVYLIAAGLIHVSYSLPLLPIEKVPEITRPYKTLYESLREFKGSFNSPPIFLAGRIGWEDLAHEVAEVYHALPEEENRQKTGIFEREYAAGLRWTNTQSIRVTQSRHRMFNYYLWGRGRNGSMIVITAFQ